MSGAVGDVFPHTRNHAHSGESQENKAGYLQPKLVQDTRKVAHGCADTVEHGPEGAASLHVLSSNTRRKAQFSSG